MTASNSPSEILSATVIDRLIESGLVRADKRDALISRIANGAMQGEDWRLEIELAITKDGAA